MHAGAQDAAERSRKPGELMVPDSDASALAAYLQLLARVVSNGPPARVPSWVAAWEAQSLVSPLWELLFQLMCHPVPQVLSPSIQHRGSWYKILCCITEACQLSLNLAHMPECANFLT